MGMEVEQWWRSLRERSDMLTNGLSRTTKIISIIVGISTLIGVAGGVVITNAVDHAKFQAAFHRHDEILDDVCDDMDGIKKGQNDNTRFILLFDQFFKIQYPNSYGLAQARTDSIIRFNGKDKEK